MFLPTPSPTTATGAWALPTKRNRSTALRLDARPEPRSLDERRVADMTLERFARAGLVVRVHSDLLGETVLFASDNATVDAANRLPVYRATELEALLRGGASDLLAQHRKKTPTRS